MNFFDFLNSINQTKKDLIKEDPHNEKEYNAFMINRALSYFPDTIIYANEMNRYASTPKDMQYAFYLNGIKAKKRFSKWHKKDQNSENINLVMKAYGYSAEKAAAALELLTADQLESLKKMFDTGGK